MISRSCKEYGYYRLTSMSWRALFIAASCCICRIIAVLGSEEELSESFSESIVTDVKNVLD